MIANKGCVMSKVVKIDGTFTTDEFIIQGNPDMVFNNTVCVVKNKNG